MKCQVRFQCAPKIKKADYDVEDILIDVEIPFAPTQGTMLKLTPDGEFYAVDEVYWDVSEPDVLQVWLVDADDDKLLPWRHMQRQGWRTA